MKVHQEEEQSCVIPDLYELDKKCQSFDYKTKHKNVLKHVAKSAIQLYTIALAM